MACNCSAPCTCPTVSVAPPVIGEPGPPTTLTVGLTELAPGNPASVSISGVPPAQHIQFLLPAGATGATGPAGPAGANGTNGQNGWGTAFELLDSFNMPAPGATTGFVTIDDNRMVEVGTWVKITGYSIEGNWFVVVAKSSDDLVQLRNPGSTDLAPYWPGSTSIPANAPTGTLFSSGELGVVVGAPGIRGLTGASGLTPQVRVVYTVPSSPPVSADLNAVVYFNAAPPSIPTVGQFYTWDGASWTAGPNFVSQGGTTTYTGIADPNTAPPSGSKVLDLYIQFVGGNAVYYQRVSPSSWVIVGTVALMGTATVSDTHTSPGTYTADAANFSYLIDADKDIDIDFDTTNYTGAGTWVFSIYNSDASPIDLTASAISTSGIPTLPLTIAPSLAAVVVIRKYSSKGTTMNKFVIEQAYIV